MTDRARQIANLVCIPAGIALNFVPGIGGASVGAITRRHESLLAASGWTFSIWSLIFLGQLAYVVYQALPAHRTDATLRRIGWHTALNGLLEGAWTVAFCKEAITASFFVMLVLLVNLVLIELRLREDARAGRELVIVRLTYGMNLGWISVATILDTSLFLWDVVGWRGAPLTPVVWCEIMMLVAAVISVAMVVVRRNSVFALAVAWGLVGIATYRWADTRVISLVGFALAAALVVLVVVARYAKSNSVRRDL
jgi:hypothetical protein